MSSVISSISFFQSWMLLIIFPIITCSLSASTIIPNKTLDPIELCLNELELELKALSKEYNRVLTKFKSKVFALQESIHDDANLKSRTYLIMEKDRWMDSIFTYKQKRKREVNRIRYLKGVEIIKILYEKSLSLDHHFAAIATLHNLEQMANPNNYKDFSVAKEKLLSNTRKKNNPSIGSILNNNIYTSIIHSMLSLFGNDNLDKKDKEDVIKQIECILDFTLRMNNDLKTVYFESMYLRMNSQKSITDIEGLFSFYTRPIGYSSTLQDCRSEDDWLTINEQVSTYMQRLDFLSKSEINLSEAEEMQVDIEFSIQRLLQQISDYNQFINQSAKFYEKFAFMLESYQTQEPCAESIPLEFVELKASIKLTIEKFNNTYKPVELNGSKMKQLLYGVGY